MNLPIPQFMYLQGEAYRNIKTLAEQLPNDQDLGRAVRSYFSQLKEREENYVNPHYQLDTEEDTTEELKVQKSFIDLLGYEKVQSLIKDNWIEFEIKPFELYKTNEIEIRFLTKDNKNDTVCFFSICYNEDRKKWFSENCIDYPNIEFDSYEEMKNHVDEIEDKIINNGFHLANL